MDIDINTLCFLCKNSNDITDEHVFPQWLQNDYNLWNQFILLKNGSKFKYGNLKVPCCSTCNTKYLSNIENKVSKLVRDGNVKELLTKKDDTFIWLYKIMYGLHYKEMFLKNNIRDPFSEFIVTKESFFEGHSYHLLLLFALGLVSFENFSPYSLFIFRLSDSNKTNYFYLDEPYKMFTSLVLGNIGIVCSFQDDGYITNEISKRFKTEQIERLTLSEFGDFASFILHLKCRMKMLPNYILQRISGKFYLKIQDCVEKELFNDFDINEHMKILTTGYHFCFQNLITKNEAGEFSIKYRSPFTYF